MEWKDSIHCTRIGSLKFPRKVIMKLTIKYDLNLLVSIMEAKEKITEELRVAHLLFTILALVCSIAEVSGHNHPHLGRSYVILIFISNWLVHIKF